MSLDYPNIPTVGQTYVSGGFRWTWDGSKWNAGSGQGGQVFSVAGRTGDVVLTHSDITDWATVTQFVPLAGGTMTGPLVLNADATTGRQAVTYQQLSGGYLPIGGGTVGPITVTSVPGGGGQFRMTNGSTGYGSLWRNDGSNTYLLLTANNDPFGTYNALRPITVGDSDGVVNLNGVCRFWGTDQQSTSLANFTGRRWRFAVNSGDEANAGTIDYRGYDGNMLSIIGAGPASGGRRYVKIWEQLWMAGGSNLNLFDDGNSHIESGTTLWLNGNTGQPVRAGGEFRAGGELYVGTNLWVNGNYWQNNGGMYTNASLNCNDLYSRNNINCAGILYMQGGQWYWTNDGGWMTCNPPMYSYSDIAAAGILRCGGRGGPAWSNNGGWMYTGSNLLTGGAVGVGGNTGIYWSNNGGWMYCPQGVMCNNINTHDINCNGATITAGQGNFGCNIGGPGVMFAWANGNWMTYQSTDAIYFYQNQGYQGGVYYSFCDERMKWNFGTVTRDCLAAINAIGLHRFDFTEGSPRQRRTNPAETRIEHYKWEDMPRIVKHIETGFIAQQVREIIPEAVPDPPEEGAYLSVDMRPMVATLIGAVQQLTARVAELEGKLN